jgi:hypothetical protein
MIVWFKIATICTKTYQPNDMRLPMQKLVSRLENCSNPQKKFHPELLVAVQ